MDFFGSLALALITHAFFIIFITFGCSNKKSKESEPKTADLGNDPEPPKQLRLTTAGILPPTSATTTQGPSTKQSSTTADSDGQKQIPSKSTMAPEEKKPVALTPQTSGKVCPKAPIVDASKGSKSEFKKTAKEKSVSQTKSQTGKTKSKMQRSIDTQKTTMDDVTTDLRTPAWMESEDYVQQKMEVQKQVAAGVH
uniref:Uncharacterized protein n=1 Tax=Panagrellus redivivus TaxID=6233 RepID=A0A7E4UYU7_PANRE